MNPELMLRLRQQYDRSLPFVAYRKPGGTVIKTLMQEDARLHTDPSYTKQGFVMAGYARSTPQVLMPGNPEIFPLCPSPRENDFQKEIRADEDVRSRYEAMVSAAIQQINSGQFQKVVLSRKQKIPVTAGPVELFERLSSNYPDAFSYIWYHPQVGLWLGATPETLLSVNGLRFKTMALAGTQQYLGSHQVTWGRKEQQEQQWVVDTLKDQLESSGVSELAIKKRETIKAGNLLHLKTEITGLLKNLEQLGSLLEVLHPTPAVCGLPRDRATDYIKTNEGYDRGFYTGFLGELNVPPEKRARREGRNIENRAYTQFNKTSALYVNLRCMEYMHNAVQLYVGGGITAGSEPDKEWLETINKMQTMLSILS